MLGPIEMITQYNIPISGLLHIGANDAREAHTYIRSGSFPVTFFEPIPALFNRAERNTKKYSSMCVINACCSDEDGIEVTFNIASNDGQSSSMLALGQHQIIHPNINYVDCFSIKTSRIETFLREIPDADMYNCAAIDTQGADLKVLKGFGACLNNFDALYVEVSDQVLYEGGATIREISDFLDNHGFALMHLESVPKFYGNALFMRRNPRYLERVVNAISVGKPVSQSSLYHDNSKFRAAKGNDGNVLGSGMFHTESEPFPWWQVDLESVTQIQGVYIFDRPGYQQRSASLVAEVSDDGCLYREVFARDRMSGPLGRNYFIPARELCRFVRIRLNDKNFLHLNQVAVV